jgi:hypothetical protein
MSDIDNGQGLIANWLDKIFGVHWTQKVRSATGYLIGLIVAFVGSYQASPQSFVTGIPWLDNAMPKIVLIATIIGGLTYGVSRRVNPVPSAPKTTIEGK